MLQKISHHYCKIIYSLYDFVVPEEKTVQATIAASASCHEALSVKKTAEIAALFADLKLNQTTDLRHLERLERSMNPVASHNMYNSFKSHGSVPCRNLTYADIKTNVHPERMMQNALYSSGRNEDKRRVFDSGHHYHSVEGDINSLENSLGYLP